MVMLAKNPEFPIEPARTGPAQPVFVAISNLRKEFRRRGGEHVVAIDNVNLEIHAGQLAILLGPSGCGKTTLLRCIAGLEQPDSGRIEINGRCVFDSARGISIPTERRNISMMFQSYALWPHMTAAENIEYAVRSRGKSHQSSMERSRSILKTMRISELHNQYPGQMSGGQQQRVALARSLAVDPQVILFDEPLSNVDAKVRDQLRLELVTMQRQLHFSGVYVTHDQIEALQLADLVAVMGDGRIHQFATPQQIYHAPASRYVATFVGQANELSGKVQNMTGRGRDRSLTVSTPLGLITCSVRNRNVSVGTPVWLVFRPEKINIHRTPVDGEINCWKSNVQTVIFSGVYSEYKINVGSHMLHAWSAEHGAIKEGDEVYVSINQSDIHVFEAE